MADMQEVGEQLYEWVVQIHPELAGKLVGMLLQLGLPECQACLRDQEKLAMRLDEALQILDNSGQMARMPVKADPSEKRIDPTDGQARTLEELRTLCKGQYSAAEIDEYWLSMEPVTKGAGKGAAAARAPVVEQAPAPVSRPPAPAPAAAVPKPAAKPAAAPAKAAAAPPKAAAAAPAGPSKPAAAAPPSQEVVKGLAAFLSELKLTRYEKEAVSWCEEMGASQLDEIVENVADFADGLQLKPLEKNRLLKNAAAAAEAAAAAPDAQAAPVAAPAAVAARSYDEPDYEEPPPAAPAAYMDGDAKRKAIAEKARRAAAAAAQQETYYADYDDEAAMDRAEIAREMLEECRGDIEHAAWRAADEGDADYGAAAAPPPRGGKGGGYGGAAAGAARPAAAKKQPAAPPAASDFPALGASTSAATKKGKMRM
eukprot:TRINITY_DN5089_c0_g1_i1.p1 TRINITY_DN5089_c0_g1~~TRINITY_DN5089_c0_g1_i1.p1  ORF type:complete len:427 (-),score=142.17 TRINITY_DN5089_c0_g1_i1:187-1467(-)